MNSLVKPPRSIVARHTAAGEAVARGGRDWLEATTRMLLNDAAAAKKIVGRERHVAVDTDGRLLMVNLTPADISDSAGALLILDTVRKRRPWLKHLLADGAYDRTKLLDKAAFRDFIVEIVRRRDSDPGFKVIPRRWVVERTFGWMVRWRRLVRGYERDLDVSETLIHVAMGSLLLRRIAHQ